MLAFNLYFLHLKVTTDILEECSLNVTLLLLNCIDRFCVKSVFKKNHFIKWWDCKLNYNLCHLSKKCLFSWLYICNAPVSFSAYTECNNTKEHGLDQCTTRSFWSGPGSPMWFPSVGQATPNPPTIPLAFTLWKEHNRHCSEDDCPLSLFSLSKIIM